MLSLSRKEFDLLALMASHPGRVFDRQTLLDRVWGEDAYVDGRIGDDDLALVTITDDPDEAIAAITATGRC